MELNVFTVQSGIMLVVTLVLLGVKAFVFVNALTHSGESYVAAGKLTKAAWVALLGIGLVFQLLGAPIGILNLVFTVAAFVYLVDVRPALRGLTRR